MKPIRLSLLALLLAVAPLWAAPPKMPRADEPASKRGTLNLQVEGDTVLVVKSMPCTVTAPAGADFYIWNVPSNVKGTVEENVLTITFAPKGASTISVVAVTIDFVKKTTKKESGSVVVTNGVEPPPPPAPLDPFAASLQSAYDADADADRAKSLAFLAAAYKGMAAQVAARTDLKTNADVVAWMKAVVGAPTVGLAPAQLKSLRTAIGAELARAWGTTTAPLAATAAAAELSKIANALGSIH